MQNLPYRVVYRLEDDLGLGPWSSENPHDGWGPCIGPSLSMHDMPNPWRDTRIAGPEVTYIESTHRFAFPSLGLLLRWASQEDLERLEAAEFALSLYGTAQYTLLRNQVVFRRYHAALVLRMPIGALSSAYAMRESVLVSSAAL